jgi:hypothetical protein
MTLENFEAELRIIICMVVGSYLIALVYFHCKHAGIPYKTSEHYKNVKHLMVVYLIWTLAFILKIILAEIGILGFVVNNN